MLIGMGWVTWRARKHRRVLEEAAKADALRRAAREAAREAERAKED